MDLEYEILLKELCTYFIGNPKPFPFLTKTINDTAFKIKPIPANIVSMISKINEPRLLKIHD